MTINKRTHANIVAHQRIISQVKTGSQETGTVNTINYACGCSVSDDGMYWLCHYHSGFDDALDEHCG